MGIIGLGSDWLSARMRMPSPPQNNTTFMDSSLPVVPADRHQKISRSRQGDDEVRSPRT